MHKVVIIAWAMMLLVILSVLGAMLVGLIAGVIVQAAEQVLATR